MKITIAPIQPSDFKTIIPFIRLVFDDAVAPTYSTEGNQEFYKYIELDAITDRYSGNHWMLQAKQDNNLVGVIEIRDNHHLSMLFVDTKKQRQGIGKKLLNAAILKIKDAVPNQKSLTVHSSPNSTTAYERFGFKQIADEKTVSGIRFISMEKSLE